LAGSISREHLWPDGLLERRKGRRRLYQTARSKEGFVGPQALQIGDVCKVCNSGPLSRLDTYFLSLYDRYITSVVPSGGSVWFEYDQDQLLRFILKLLYNNARACDPESEHVRTLGRREFILHGEPAPRDLHLFLQLVVPHPVNGEEVAPSYLECGRLDAPGFNSRFAQLYFVGVDSYRFILAALNGPPAISGPRVAKGFREAPHLEGATRLLRDESSRTIRASTVTAFHVMANTILENFEYFAGRSRARGGNA
jgi:hypothetical protein